MYSNDYYYTNNTFYIFSTLNVMQCNSEIFYMTVYITDFLHHLLLICVFAHMITSTLTLLYLHYLHAFNCCCLPL